MARRPPEDDDPVDAPKSRRSRRRSGGRPEPEAIREWDGGDDAPSADGSAKPRREKRPIYFRARDSLWFEPLVALCLIVLLLVSLYAYTGNWPPLYVVESPSMQHGTGYTFGAINTGDMVLAKQIPSQEIVPYVAGAQTGYRTYTEYGDVILYRASGQASPVPIIHRAIVYIVANANGTYTIPSLNGQSCGPSSDYVYSTSVGPCTWENLRAGVTLTLFNVGWQSVSVPIDLAEMGSSSGFVTMGDNNFGPGPSGLVGYIDQPTRGGLVQPSWIVGVARGLIPWFGAIKLALQGNAQTVPAASWWFMGLTIAAIVLLAFGIHYAFRPPARRSKEPASARDPEDADDEEDEGSAPPPSKGRRRRGRSRPPPERSPPKSRSGPGGDSD